MYDDMMLAHSLTGFSDHFFGEINSFN
jgi:hypothetical protein